MYKFPDQDMIYYMRIMFLLTHIQSPLHSQKEKSFLFLKQHCYLLPQKKFKKKNTIVFYQLKLKEVLVSQIERHYTGPSFEHLHFGRKSYHNISFYANSFPHHWIEKEKAS